MPNPTRFYEDIAIGEVRESSTRTITLEEMLEFATRYDPQYFHNDPEAARNSVFGEVVASGLFTAAIWRILDHEISGDIRWICGVGWEDVRWPRAVRPGDTLRAGYETLSKRPSKSDARRGIVVCRYTVLNQNAEIVFTCVSTNLVERRPGS